jgi:tetratricopeptide (TPR) repeat protein
MKILKLFLLAVGAGGLAGCLATAPIHPEASRHNQTGVGHLRAGDLHRAEVCFRLSLEYNPCHADARHNLALVFLMRGDLDRAEKYEWEALECRADLVQAVNGLGVIYRKRGDLKTASELFAEAIGLDPGYLDARRNLIVTALDLGDTDRARIHLDRLAVLSPDDPLLSRVGQESGQESGEGP